MDRKIARIAMAVVVILTCITAVPPASGLQTPQSGESSDYYIIYNDNRDDGTGADLFITSANSTYGVVEIPGVGFSQNFTVLAGTITTVDIPLAAEVQGSDVIANLGIRVQSNDDITVYLLNPGEPVYTNDAYVALPVEALGTEYIVMAWQGGSVVENPSELAIVSPFDDTSVTIIPSITTGARLAGVPYTVVLDQYQTYTLQSDDYLEDLTGTIIQSSSPIGLFTGSRCANIPSESYGCCDHIVEQLIPTNAWGTAYVTTPLASRTGGDILRVLASVDGTTVDITGSVMAGFDREAPADGPESGADRTSPCACSSDDLLDLPTWERPALQGASESTVVLNRGEYYDMLATGPVELVADQPVLLAQYSTSQYFGGLGDPFMMLIPPSEQFLSKYVFLTPTGYDVNFVSVIAPTSATDSVILDGTAVDPVLFSPIGSGDFSGAAISLAEGSHTIWAGEAFGIFVYGFGHCVSYGYPGGLGTSTINPPPPPDKPLIIVPGLAGTKLLNDQGELWIGIDKIIEDFLEDVLVKLCRPDNDYLDVTQLDAWGTGPLHPGDPHYTSVEPGDVVTRVEYHDELPIIGPIDLDMDIYGGLIDYFASQGYVLGETLFLFGYDWRRDLKETAEQLDELIDSHRSGGQVNLVAHSMGGLVSRNYILDPDRAAKVDNLVILGTPFLGAPQSFEALYLGDDFGINQSAHDKGLPSFCWLINPGKIKQIARNWPGIYEILPSERYFDVYEDGYILEDRDIDGDHTAGGALDYQETESVIMNLLNNTVAEKAKQFHTGEFDGFGSGTNGVDVYLIVGVGLGTKERIRFWEEKTWFGFKTVEHVSWWYGNGDQTVVQRSADLHDDDTDYRGDVGLYYAKVVHGDLPKNSHVQQQISQLFAGNLAPVNSNISLTPDPWPFEGYWQEANSPVELHIYDELGNHLGPTGTDVIEYGIRNAQYDWNGEDKSAFVPKGIGYTVVLSGTEEGEFDLRLRDVASGTISNTVLFQDIPVDTGTIASVSVTGEDGYVMAYDENGDGEVDAWLEPTVILDPEDSLDVIPPVTTISLEGETNERGWFTGDVMVTMAAEDNPNGSGVDRIEYSLDEGETVQLYTGPFTVHVDDVGVVYAKAVDLAGNQEFPLSAARLSPLSTHLPLVLRSNN